MEETGRVTTAPEEQPIRCVNCGQLLPSGDAPSAALHLPGAGVPTQPLREGQPPEHCPTCGLPTAASLAGAGRSAAVDEQGIIDRNVICRRCGYNLRGLTKAGVCPECATPIQLSLQEDLLCFAGPPYVRKLARGSRWVAGGMILIATGFALTLILMALWLGAGASFLGNARDWMVMAGALCGPALGLTGALFSLAGIWVITAPERDRYDDRHRVTPRRVVRVCLLLGLLGILLNRVVSGLAPPVPVMAAFAIASCGFWAAGVVGVRAYFRHVQRVCERVPDGPQARRAAALATWLPVALGAIVFFATVDTLLRWGPAPYAGSGPTTAPVQSPSWQVPAGGWGESWMSLRRCVGSAAWLAVVVLFFGALRLHRGLPDLLAQQAALAEQLQVHYAPLATRDRVTPPQH